MRAVLTVIFVIVTRAVSEVCNYENSVELTDRSYNGIKYGDGEYFVDNATGVERGCVCMKEKCARKCCPFGQAYHQTKKICVDLAEAFNPPVKEGGNLMPEFNILKEFHFLFYKMNCSIELGEYRVPIAGTAKDYHLTTDGNLYVHIDGENSLIYNSSQYCIDNFVTADSLHNKSEYQPNALICFSTTPPPPDHYEVSSICMLISCFFIVLTVAVYAWLPELRSRLHGMVLMAYLLCFFVGFLFMSTMQISLLFETIDRLTCDVFTFIIYVSLLSAFFWLNVMCYDIWRTFSGRRSLSSQTNSDRKRFINYSYYAFGVPVALTIFLIILEYGVDASKSRLLPNIRNNTCFISGYSKLIYLYIPIVVLCVANLIFFSLTAWKIYQIKKQTKVLNKKDKQRFSLYIKLFIVMGVNWILEVVSSFYPKADNIWVYTDAYNVLVGVIIFIIFVCKKKTLRMIKQRIKNCQRSDTSIGAMKDINNIRLSRWQNSNGVRDSINTIRTTLGFSDTDSKRSDKSSKTSHS